MATTPVSKSVRGVKESTAGEKLGRQFNFWSACSLGVITGCAWPLFGGTIVISLYNGGPPGVLYELIAIGVIYVAVSASIAELASAMPSSAGVYYWATVTGGERYGTVLGFYAGWLNCFAYIFATIATSSISATQLVQMYALFHPDYSYERWHNLVAFFACSWVACGCVMFGHRFLARINDAGLFFILAGVFITVVVCVSMPAVNGNWYADNRTVWSDWQNETGYSSNGFVFLMGMLNGAFALGVPDCISHIAEEVVNPGSVVPKAIFAQVAIGFASTFVYLVAIFYATTDLPAVTNTTSLFPVAAIHQQATRSAGGTLGLSILIFLPSFWAIIGAYVTAGRMLWTLGRGNASPFSKFIGHVSVVHHNPLNATLCAAMFNALVGLIYLGSTTAFNAFATSMVCLNLLSYLATVLPHLAHGRNQFPRGAFWMKGRIGTAVHSVTCAYIVVFMVIFCFPYSMPVTPESMNYSSVIVCGLVLVITIWWSWKRSHGYVAFASGVLNGIEAEMGDATGVQAFKKGSEDKVVV